jgi:hypothetical protein
MRIAILSVDKIVDYEFFIIILLIYLKSISYKIYLNINFKYTLSAKTPIYQQMSVTNLNVENYWKTC